MRDYNYKDVATRAAVVSLKALAGWSSADIAVLLGISVRQVNRFYARAIKAGFDPSARPLQINNSLFTDLPRSGRPSKLTPEVRDFIIDAIQRSGDERISARQISEDLKAEGHIVSTMVVWRFLKKCKLESPQPANSAGLSDHLADLDLSQHERESAVSEGDED
ncbi:hypothetical protein TARUN_4472 [Trichoderma arundinaceum]|uniref:RNA polymerase sigma factor 70 region 4 type 2 domain-containing protein n=1 Tax=Trichoderma arundinaceum TaxID=490622 RepID=A0A395NP93_TRIAR|nr:hypothetical protein TARUN_4472 [Trichoderma arundinaceum]